MISNSTTLGEAEVLEPIQVTEHEPDFSEARAKIAARIERHKNKSKGQIHKNNQNQNETPADREQRLMFESLAEGTGDS